MTKEILEILSEDSRRTPEEIAVMLDADGMMSGRR